MQIYINSHLELRVGGTQVQDTHPARPKLGAGVLLHVCVCVCCVLCVCVTNLRLFKIFSCHQAQALL